MTRVVQHHQYEMAAATHQCRACLQKTINYCPPGTLPVGFVLAGSPCDRFPNLGHNWMAPKVSHLPDAFPLNQEIIDRISSGILRLTISDCIHTTALVWDFVDDKVQILTNYHTWNMRAFKHMFPLEGLLKKCDDNIKANNEDINEIKFNLKNDHINLNFNLTSDMFFCYDKKHDFVILQLPYHDFAMMKRIEISFFVQKFLKIYTFGYVAKKEDFNQNIGEICSKFRNGFKMNLFASSDYSGPAVVYDGTGRAIGYMGGNYDASDEKKYFRGITFDHVVVATKRNFFSPPTSATGKYSPKCSDTNREGNNTAETG